MQRCNGAFHSPQVLYAAQRHTHLLPEGKRAGFFIGDGAGVGKVRELPKMAYRTAVLDAFGMLTACINTHMMPLYISEF